MCKPAGQQCVAAASWKLSDNCAAALVNRAQCTAEALPETAPLTCACKRWCVAIPQAHPRAQRALRDTACARPAAPRAPPPRTARRGASGAAARPARASY